MKMGIPFLVVGGILYLFFCVFVRQSAYLDFIQKQIAYDNLSHFTYI